MGKFSPSGGTLRTILNLPAAASSASQAPSAAWHTAPAARPAATAAWQAASAAWRAASAAWQAASAAQQAASAARQAAPAARQAAVATGRLRCVGAVLDGHGDAKKTRRAKTTVFTRGFDFGSVFEWRWGYLPKINF